VAKSLVDKELHKYLEGSFRGLFESKNTEIKRNNETRDKNLDKVTSLGHWI